MSSMRGSKGWQCPPAWASPPSPPGLGWQGRQREPGYEELSLCLVRCSVPFQVVWVGRASLEGGLAVSGRSPHVLWVARRCCLVLEGLCGFTSLLACPQLTGLLTGPKATLQLCFRKVGAGKQPPSCLFPNKPKCTWLKTKPFE